MNIEKDDVSVITGFIAFLLTVLGIGSGYQKLKSDNDATNTRVEVLEQKPPYVLLASCEERRAGCGRENRLQFDAGERQFAEIKKLIADNDRASNERHAEAMQRQNDMMKILLEMNRP